MIEPQGDRTSCEHLSPDVIAQHLAAGYRLVTVEDVLLHALAHVDGVPLPEGLRLEAWDQASIPRFFAAHVAAFAERPGFPGWSMERWASWTAGEETFRADLSRVALAIDGSPVAFITCDDASGEGDSEAYIVQVGVHPKWRRMGIGLHLVTAALSSWRREGRTGVIGHVNVNNPGSFRMLARAGFRKVRQRGVFERSEPR